MKRLACVFVFVFVVASAALSFEYVVQKHAGGLTTPANQITSLTGGNWNDGYYDLAISGLFYFYGRRVTHIRIMTDGYIVLGFGSAPSDTDNPTNSVIPNPAAPNGYVAPWWDDWDLTTAGTIWYVTNITYTGVEWRDIPHHDDPTARYIFGIGLYTNNYQYFPNSVYFYYRDVDTGTGAHDAGKTGTIGIEHPTGYQGEEFSYFSQAVPNNYTVTFVPFVPVYDTTDFWGTGKPDLVVFRPSDGIWYKQKNDGSETSITNWGIRGDIPVPGDYDGDGAAEECIVRPGEHYLWYGLDPAFCIPWGTQYDIPVPADFNNDGETDLAVFRSNGGLWYIYYRGSGSSEVIQWGTRGDVPLPADYDGDGTADCAVYRPSNNTWYIRRSSNPGSPWIKAWGTNGDIPLPNKFTVGTTPDICVFRPSTGQWFAYNPLTQVSNVGQWGMDGDQPVPNDWAALGTSNLAVFRPSDGNWYIKSVAGVTRQWGAIGDKPRCRRSGAVFAPLP